MVNGYNREGVTVAEGRMVTMGSDSCRGNETGREVCVVGLARAVW
jgi:hypothetical protein